MPSVALIVVLTNAPPTTSASACRTVSIESPTCA